MSVWICGWLLVCRVRPTANSSLRLPAGPAIRCKLQPAAIALFLPSFPITDCHAVLSGRWSKMTSLGGLSSRPNDSSSSSRQRASRLTQTVEWPHSQCCHCWIAAAAAAAAGPRRTHHNALKMRLRQCWQLHNELYGSSSTTSRL